MRPVLKNIASSFMLVITALPLFFILYFHIQQQVIRHNMMEKLEKEYLRTLTATSKEFTWKKNGKEIRIHGELFDVKSFTIEGGRYYFRGLFDKDETNIEKQLSHTGTPQTRINRSLQQLFQVLQSVYTHGSLILLPSEIIDITARSFSREHLVLPDIYLHIPTPPPKSYSDFLNIP